MTMAHRALALKEEGNVYFANGNYTEAETCYTQAIQKDPKNPKLFTNRAMTRSRRSKWDNCIDDCLHAIELDNENMKAYYLLAQAQLALHHPNEAYTSAISAYDRCLQTQDKSIQNVSSLVLQTKKMKWEFREREKERQRNALLRECVQGLENNLQEELLALDMRNMGQVQKQEEKVELEGAVEQKKEELHSIFAIANPEELPRREVPDYLIDNVTFAIMHDPVTTKTGISYDRSTMVEHLKRSQKDPLTGDPLRYEDLRPNRALKEASEKFLEENGWAVDW